MQNLTNTNNQLTKAGSGANMLAAALEYAEAGFAVFPLLPGEKIPLRNSQGMKEATTNKAMIESWWTKTPQANIGISMGKISGIFGIDIDFKDGCDPTFPQKLPPTIMVRTPTGGLHAFFKYPSGGIRNNKKLEKGATVRSEGYYFVAVPSIHPDTKTAYKYEGTRGLIDGEVAECPQWVFEHPGMGAKPAEAVRQGERHDTLVKKAASYRKAGREKDWAFKKLIDINNKFPDGPKTNLEVLQAVEWAWAHVEVVPKEAPKPKITEKEIVNIARDVLDDKFKLVSDRDANVLYHVENLKNKELAVCNNEEYLLTQMHKSIVDKMKMVPTENFLRKAYGLWKRSTDTIDLPLPFSWKNQDDWSFKKLDFIPSAGLFESWVEFLVRLSAPEDFMAFIWSIFENKSKSRQYLYLYDPNGEGGKSTILNVLGEVFGNSFVAINNSFVGGEAARWLLGNLLGRRLVVWPDCKNTKFCMSELLRNITSGDSVTVEYKGKQPFTSKMYLKFIISSNHEPSITGGGADLSRLIRIDLAKNTNTNDPEWGARLRAELPYFLYECKTWYDMKCKNHGNIQLQSETTELSHASTSDVEEKYEAIASNFMTFSKGLESNIKAWTQLCRDHHLNGMEVGNLKDYLRQNYGAVITRAKGGSKQMLYQGFAIRGQGIL